MSKKAKPSPPPTLDSIQAFMEIVELDGVEVYELRGRGIKRGDETIEEGFTIRAGIFAGTEEFKARFTLVFSATAGEYLVDLAVRYALDNPAVVPQEVAMEFVERVAVMAAYPFLREQVFGLASRLGHPVPVLGILRQGMFQLEPDQPQPETASISVEN